MDFVRAENEVDSRKLSDEDLKAYHDICLVGVIDASEELRKRGL